MEIRVRSERGRTLAVAAAAVVVVSAAVAVLLFNRSAPGIAAAFPAAPGLAIPSSPAAERPEPGSSMIGVVADAPEKPMSLAQFIDGLETEPAGKAAPTMKAALLSEPKVRSAYESFKKLRGGSAPAAEFMRTVRPMPEFRQLLARFRGDPGFQGAWLKLSSKPAMAKALMGQMPSEIRVASRPGGPRGGGMSGFEGPGGLGGSHGGARGGGAMQSQGPTQTAEGPVAPPNGSMPSSVNASAGSHSAPGESGPVNGNSSGSQASAGGAGPQSGGYDVKTTLDKSYQSAVAQQSMSETIRDWLQNQCGIDPKPFETSMSQGIWDQCFSSRKLASCDSCCQQAPNVDGAKTLCTKPDQPNKSLPYWDACMQAEGNDQRQCLVDCSNQSPCEVDPAVYDFYCLAPLRKTPPGAPDPVCAQVKSSSGGRLMQGVEVWQCEETAPQPGQYAWWNDGTCWVDGVGSCNDPAAVHWLHSPPCTQADAIAKKQIQVPGSGCTCRCSATGCTAP